MPVEPAPPPVPGGAYAAQPAAYAPGVVFDYASWGTRAIGFIIDGLLVGVGMALVYLVIGGVLAGMAGLAGHDFGSSICCMTLLLFPIASLLVGLYNSVYLVAQRGYSIGQGVVKIKVVDGNGRLLTQGSAFARLLVRVLLSFVAILGLLDLLWPLWDVRRQTLHDKAVNCYVINNPTGV